MGGLQFLQYKISHVEIVEGYKSHYLFYLGDGDGDGDGGVLCLKVDDFYLLELVKGQLRKGK